MSFDKNLLAATKSLIKTAFLPPDALAAGPQMGMPPAGMPPGFDPSMMQGPPPGFDPSMMQGPPPGFDPSMMQGPPPGFDPSMMQGPPPEEEEPPAEKSNGKSGGASKRIDALEAKFDMLLQMMTTFMSHKMGGQTKTSEDKTARQVIQKLLRS